MHLHPLVLALLFATTLSSQQPPTLAATANTTMIAQIGGPPATLAAGSTLLPTINLQAGTGTFMARTTSASMLSPTNVEFALTDAATVPNGMTPLVASTGSHEALVQFQATTPVRAILQLRWVGSTTSATQGGAVARVDINNDGSYEFDSRNAMSLDVPVQFGPGSLSVRVTTVSAMVSALQSGGSFAGGSANGTITVRLVPDAGITAQAYSQGCSGPAFAARPNFGNGVDLVATGLATSNVACLLAIGFAPQSLQLPVAPFCTLDTTVAAVATLVPDATGTATLPLVVPAGLRPLTFRTQAAAFDMQAMTLMTSPALLVQCQ